MTLHRIINFTTLLLLVLDLIWFSIRLVKNGKPHLPEEKGFLIRIICIYISSLAIITMCFFIDFGTMGNIALNGSGLLGTESANRQLFNY